MTPKEKAKELFDKFCLAIKTEGDEFGYWTNTIHAKQCALISVEELIKEKNKWENGSFYTSKYWDYVKQEIENL
jgi:hypothetical protein